MGDGHTVCMEATSKCHTCNTTSNVTTGGSYGHALCKSCYGKWRRQVKKAQLAHAAATVRAADALDAQRAAWKFPAEMHEQDLGPCTVMFSHCEQCGRAAEGCMENDGYSGCCNELIVWEDCRNHHAER
jgi:hypothetical protein